MQDLGHQVKSARGTGLDPHSPNAKHELQLIRNSIAAESAHVEKQVALLRSSLVRMEGDMALLTSDVKLALQKTAHAADSAERRMADFKSEIRRQLALYAEQSLVETIAYGFWSVPVVRMCTHTVHCTDMTSSAFAARCSILRACLQGQYGRSTQDQSNILASAPLATQ